MCNIMHIYTITIMGRQHIIHYKHVLIFIYGESYLHASHREEISKGSTVRLLTGKRANGHLTFDRNRSRWDSTIFDIKESLQRNA